MNGNALIVHSNTAFSHIQLYDTNKPITKKSIDPSYSSNSSSVNAASSDADDIIETEIVSVLKCMNNTSHLRDDDLLTGNEVLDDWWIQDYLEYM